VNSFSYRTCHPKPILPSVHKLKFYFKLPYYNHLSSSLANNLVNELSAIYPQVEFIPALSNSSTVGSLFKFKDTVTLELRSGVSYKYSCGGCDANYIGCTRQRL